MKTIMTNSKLFSTMIVLILSLILMLICISCGNHVMQDEGGHIVQNNSDNIEQNEGNSIAKDKESNVEQREENNIVQNQKDEIVQNKENDVMQNDKEESIKTDELDNDDSAQEDREINIAKDSEEDEDEDINVPTDGLILWLDADDKTSVVVDEDGRVSEWINKTNQSCNAVADVMDNKDSRPEYIYEEINGRNVIRFNGSHYLTVDGINRDTAGDVTVFVISQRISEQSSDDKWQRILSCWDGSDIPDNKQPNFCLVGTKPGENDGNGAEYELDIFYRYYTDVKISSLGIGVNLTNKNHQFLKGDIAEILIYDRKLKDEEVENVNKYFTNKWGVEVKRWIRTGDLGEVPERINDEYPLSDQNNTMRWVLHEPMSDEFNGEKLDENKWFPYNNRGWIGREPVMFHKDCVEVKDGKLVLSAYKQSSEKTPKNMPEGYTHVSGFVTSKTTILYGYFEMRAKLMDSTLTSCFWLSNHAKEEWTEIDAVEIGAGVEGRRNVFSPNLHRFYSPTSSEHIQDPEKWYAPFDFADDYHVYGLEWDPKEIKWYIDGVLIRVRNNDHWHQPLYLNINNEANPYFDALPDDNRLPASYEIDYVRVWQRDYD